MTAVQGSLFAFERIDLGEGAWVDVARGWLDDADDLCQRLIEGVAWRQRTRRMYDRVLDEPRLVHWYGTGDRLPEERLEWFRMAVGRRYGVRFDAMGLNYYRDGSDSVAWHADRELRHLSDTLVAIVTLGAARPFLLRPKTGGRKRSLDLHPASGDLLVMGGRCQELWEHAVPKVTSPGPERPGGPAAKSGVTGPERPGGPAAKSGATGPRISASVRWVRPRRD